LETVGTDGIVGVIMAGTTGTMEVLEMAGTTGAILIIIAHQHGVVVILIIP